MSFHWRTSHKNIKDLKKFKILKNSSSKKFKPKKNSSSKNSGSKKRRLEITRKNLMRSNLTGEMRFKNEKDVYMWTSRDINAKAKQESCKNQTRISTNCVPDTSIGSLWYHSLFSSKFKYNWYDYQKLRAWYRWERVLQADRLSEDDNWNGKNAHKNSVNSITRHD